MSLEVIKAQNDKATLEARGQKLEPYIAKCNGDTEVKKCWRLGDYTPKGWQKVETYFVDNSGLGANDELALTFRQFLGKVKQGYGYSIGEAGQFQVYIHEYKRI